MTGGRLRRVRALVGLGLGRAVARATGPHGGRTRLAIAGVALAVAVLVIVGAVGAGLATDATVRASDVDYWVTPEDGTSSPLVDAGGPALGSVHGTTDGVREREAVTYATPVLARPLRLEPTGDGSAGGTAAGDGDPVYVLAVGVVGGEEPRRVAGLSPAELAPDDPHYGDGDYDGEWTGDLVAAPGAATALGVGGGDRVGVVDGDAEFTVRTVDEGADGPVRETPVVLVQLSELQSLTGATEHDRADQLLVATSDPGVREDLATLYPETRVETRGGLLARNTVDEGLPLALAATGVVVALVVGTLVVCTTLGMEVLADRRSLATMAAVGLSTRSRLVVVGAQALATTVVGGLAGAVLGVAGVLATNRLLAWQLGLGGLATLHPLVVVAGVGVAAVVGCCALPYLLVLVRRVGGVEVVDGA